MTKLLKEFNKKDYFFILICILLIVFQVWLDLRLPDYMSEITKLVQTEGSKMSDILTQGSYMLLCAGGSLISAVIVGYLTSYISATFSQNTRKTLFTKVQEFSMEEIKKFKTSSLITRTTNDITNIQMFISMGLQMLIKAPITAVWAILKILGKNYRWSIATLVAVLVMLAVITTLMLIVLPRFKIVQKLIDNINDKTRENLNGIRVVRAFNAEKYQESRFEEGNNKLTNTQMFNQRMMSIMSPTMYLIMNLLPLSIYFIGAGLINSAGMFDRLNLFSDMIVFSSYAMQVIMAFLMLSMIFVMYPRASVSVDRIREILDTKTKITDGTFDLDTNLKGDVEFKNVSFKYPDADEYILKNISFKAKSGDTLALIGSTGSGKSTIVNLIMRFYDVTEGEILIDGKNIKDYKLSALYKKIGYVPQRAVMFNGSVKYNVSYGDKKVSDEEMKKAAKVAQATEFIENMPKKYNAIISQGGTNISGGQKQRVAIARAIARNPEIFVFDDSFSALDYKTDYVLRKELKKTTKKATNIIVAQRIGTIINADKIIVLDNGKMVGSGTHKELLKKCKVYKEIALSQLSKEELENE
ncbi:MAG: ABC transporter ATP-binding protein/permease [Tenericutes bacterium]|nr:ABC transporter ATP-binding protein/permease [Mycoplasmatota bacterium]